MPSTNGVRGQTQKVQYNRDPATWQAESTNVLIESEDRKDRRHPLEATKVKVPDITLRFVFYSEVVNIDQRPSESQATTGE